MNLWDILIIAVIAGITMLALKAMNGKGKSGGCSCGCGGCSKDCSMRKPEKSDREQQTKG